MAVQQGASVTKLFYIAAGYNRREQVKDFSEVLQARTQDEWQPCMRWVSDEHAHLEPYKCAEVDVEDLKKADALVILHGESTKGGMWVELGLALAWSKHIILVKPSPSSNYQKDPPVFGFLPEVYHTEYDTLDVAGLLMSIDEDFHSSTP